MSQQNCRRHSRITDPRLRSHRAAAAAWTLSQGRPVRLDALDVILIAHAVRTGSGFSTTWTAEDIGTLLWQTGLTTSRSLGMDVPTGLAETLWNYLSFLDATNALEGDLADLRDELRTCAGLDRTGRLRHPTGGVRRTAAGAEVLEFPRPLPTAEAITPS
jgi:hypothetical protein